MPKVKPKEKEGMCITDVPLSTIEKDGKKAIDILKSKEDDFKELMDKLNKENVNVRSIGCDQIVRRAIFSLNVPVNFVIAELERLKFDLLNANNPKVEGEPQRSYLG